MESASRLFGSGLTYVWELVAIELRNMEALRLAQQKMVESMGVLAQRQAEMAQETLRRSFDPAPSPPAGLQTAVIGQVASLKTAILESQANSNILSELAARGSGEVAGILQSRMIAALDEFTAALQQTMPQQALPTPVAPTVQLAPSP